MKIEKYQIKADIPLITEQEINDILNHRDDIVHEYTKQFIAKKEMVIAQLIMSNQQEEIEQLRKENKKLKRQLKNKN